MKRTARTISGGLMLAAALAVMACRKDAPVNAALPGELARPRAARDAATLPSPTLLAHVPADTPYVLASLVPVPLTLWTRISAALSGPFAAVARATFGTEEGGLGTAILAELQAAAAPAGVAALGLSPSPNFVLYGLGLTTGMLRLDIADEATLLAAVQRVATRAQRTLPPPAELAGRRYWRIPLPGDGAAVIGLADKQLVLAAGPASSIEDKLGLILGVDMPPRSVGATRALQAAYAAHGFGPHFVGLVDVRRVIEETIALAGAPNDACRAETAAIATAVPRIVIGSTLGEHQIVFGAVFELAPAVRARLAGLRRAVPGLVEAIAGEPMFAMSIGLDLARGHALVHDAADALGELGGACDLRALTAASEEMFRATARPVPPELAGLHGGAVAIHDLVFGAGSLMPTAIDALVLLAAERPEAIRDLLARALPIQVPADGQLHAVAVPGVSLPGELLGGLGARALVLGMGPTARAAATTALTATARGTSPLVVMSYDYGRFMALQAQLTRMTAALAASDAPAGGAIDAQAQLTEAMAALYGRATAIVDVTTEGLVSWGTIAIK